MTSKNKIAVIGGDKRQYATAQALKDRYCVYLWGTDAGEDEELYLCDNISCALEGARAVVLPLPVSADGGATLNCGGKESINLTLLAEKLKDAAYIAGGRFPQDFKAKLEADGAIVYDYFDAEEFQIKNAYTTAEAALNIAMNSLTRNIRGSNIAVTGYGRIAKHLCDLLQKIGASVTVAARSEADLAWACTKGFATVSIGGAGESNINMLSNGFDVIFNTVPAWLFGREFLEAVDKRTFIIDLASAPGGVDVVAAKELSSNVIWALSLPGKYAPDSAGEMIAQCVIAFLQKRL